MQKYHSPVLSEFGRIDQVTLGSSGGQGDFIVIISNGVTTINSDPANPTCTNNVPSGFCFHMGS
jgi:hypothetical protein